MIQKKTATNISEYLALIRERGYSCCYRGQVEDWPLIPSISRLKDKLFIDGLLEVEEEIISKFRQYSYPYIENKKSSYFDLIIQSQHYGLPTRLLDFTTNPLIALYFAVEKNSNSKSGVVWAIDEFSEDKEPNLNLDEIVFYEPNHINERIINQKSVFAVFPLKRNTEEIEPLENQNMRILQKITIPFNSKEKIKDELNFLGINEMSIYPGMEGIVNQIRKDLILK